MRKDVAKLIGENLHQLPLPGGKSIQFLHYSSFGQTDEIKAKIAKRAQMVGTSVVHLLEQNGYKITHVNDPKPVDQPEKRVSAHCAHCAAEVLNLRVDDNLKTTLNAQAMRMLSQLKPNCPHE
jgi:hypothetical protein